jgi:Xaa-Pro aminopeptidase
MIKDNYFGVDFFRGNRHRLRQQLKSGLPIVVAANGLVQRGSDTSYPFYQDANFWYLSGINNPDIILVMEEAREYLIVPQRDGVMIDFDGQIDHTLLAAVSGIDELLNESAGWKRLDAAIAKYAQLASPAPPPAFIEQFGIYANPARHRLMERIERHANAQFELVDIRPQLAKLRMIKQEPEIRAIQQAIDITTATLKPVLSRPPGTYKYEYQVEADITHGFRSRGAGGHAFEPIVAGGRRATTIHNIANSSLIADNELVVIDVGAEFRGYAADITRVYAATPTPPTSRQKEIYQAVVAAQTYAFSLLGPGVRFQTYEHKVTKFIGEQLKQLGLIKSITEANIRRYFPHATSHFLGLNVHDVGDYSLPMRPGTVLTVEPGIYVKEEGTGIRIEDDVLITNDGYELLSTGLPTGL